MELYKDKDKLSEYIEKTDITFFKRKIFYKNINKSHEVKLARIYVLWYNYFYKYMYERVLK